MSERNGSNLLSAKWTSISVDFGTLYLDFASSNAANTARAVMSCSYHTEWQKRTGCMVFKEWPDHTNYSMLVIWLKHWTRYKISVDLF